MNKLLSLFLMMPLAVLAAAEEEAAHAPSEPVSMVYVVIFALVFFGMIGGFFVYLWWNEKHNKPE